MPPIMDFSTPPSTAKTEAFALKPPPQPKPVSVPIVSKMAPAVEQPPPGRPIGDPASLRTSIFDRVKQAAATLPPRANKTHTLALVDVDYDQDEPAFTKAQQKRALLAGETLARRLKGTWRLTDNATNQVLAEKRTTITRVPYLTSRGTFVVNGSEYGLQNQQRLRPSSYSRVRDNGELETQVNPLASDGFSQKYHLDREKYKFYATVKNNKIAVLPLLKALGAKDEEIKAAWGDDIYNANRDDDTPAMLDKIFAKVDSKTNPKHLDIDQKRALIAAAFQKMRLDPEVTRHTLGQPIERMGKDAVLALTTKLLKLSRGEAEPDDRDHMANQTVFGPEDLLAERISRDYDGVQNKLLWESAFRKNLDYVQPNALEKQQYSALMKSGLGMPLEEVNPLEILDKMSRISRMGEGGIGSTQGIPSEARAVQPSQMGFVDGSRTPENMAAGVDVYLARSVRKSDDGQLYAPVRDVRTGKTLWKTPSDIRDATVAFAGAMKQDQPQVQVIRNGQLDLAFKEDVDFEIPRNENTFSPLAALIPLKSMSKPHRIAMGARMLTQAMSLMNPQAPLVQTGDPDNPDKSFHRQYGEFLGALRAKQGGRVVDVTPDEIKVQYDDGQVESHDLYNMFPFNRRSYMHQTPMVKPGDRFEPDQMLAKSNYTDDNGDVALGLNVYTLYAPYQGRDYEDAVVISESLSDRLTSRTAFTTRQEYGKDSVRSKKDYAGVFASKYPRAILDKLDDDGVIKVGEKVSYEDPLVLHAVKQSVSRNRIAQRNKPTFSDQSQVWEHSEPGVVTDVVKTDKGVSVVVQSQSKMKLADKLSGLFGDKGVVAKIVPDDEMPYDSNGRRFEMITSELGITSRTNSSQAAEAILGKVAEKTGKVYKINDFEDIEDLQKFAEAEGRKHGITLKDDYIDPVTNRKVKGAFTGVRHIMKLYHDAEKKASGRSTGGYTADESPSKGGDAGSKRVGTLLLNALISHGSTGVLEDIAAFRGQKNDDVWLAYMRGQTPPTPRIPKTYQKFVNGLRAGGLNPVPDGDKLQIYAMTRQNAIDLTEGREIKNPELVRPDKDMAPVAGGLFDPNLTGGNEGNRWAYIKLPEPMPNPVMEEPIRRLMGLTGKAYREVLAGRQPTPWGTGPQGVMNFLDKLDVDREISIAKTQVKSGRISQRDEASRRLRYLQRAKQYDVHPRDWVLDRVPVMPPRFRPVSVMQDTGQLMVSDLNYLYQELIDAKDNLAGLKDQVDDVGEERLGVYDAWKSVVGLTDPVHPKLKQKGVRGVFAQIAGTSSPKFGNFQRQVLSRTVDMVGRGVIIPDPDLDMDSVGIPEPQLWSTFEVPLVRRLVRRGMPLVEAMKAVEDKTSFARNELMEELKVRPVLLDRAPVLHKFSSMAFFARPVVGNALRIPPVVTGPFGADFDGDTMQFHVPMTDRAVEDAIERQLPSKNLLSPGDFKKPMYGLGQSYLAGLFLGSEPPDEKKVRRAVPYRSVQDVVKAFRNSEINFDDVVDVPDNE